ncbi:hypothetical protein F4801DRAFT_551360 [Xylaria longipes]|nr:hypothetical protein F4801DRAFT_551360 [Xylaria longipes]
MLHPNRGDEPIISSTDAKYCGRVPDLSNTVGSTLRPDRDTLLPHIRDRVDPTKYRVRFWICQSEDAKRLNDDDLSTYWASSKEFGGIVASNICNRTLYVYTNDLATYRALHYNGGAALQFLLNCQIHILADSYAFVVHKFRPKDKYCRRLNNEVLQRAIEPSGHQGRILKVWKTYSMWIVQLANHTDALKIGRCKRIILDGAVWAVTPFDLRGLPVYCFICGGPHTRDVCPTTGRYCCGVCSENYTVGTHDSRTCQREPKCVYCGKDHVAWVCTSDVRADVKAMRARAQHYRQRMPTWYLEDCESTGDRRSTPVPKTSRESKAGKTKPTKAGKEKLKQTYLPVDFLLKHQKPSRTTGADAPILSTTPVSSTTPPTLRPPSPPSDINVMATFTTSASAEPFAPSLEKDADAVARYNALFVSDASSIAPMATQDRLEGEPAPCAPSANPSVSPGNTTESVTALPDCAPC